MPTVTVKPGGEVVHLAEGETILAGLFRAGFAYRVGCRRGGCGICKVDLRDGDVGYGHVIAETVLSDGDRAEGVCLSCRAVPQGDITIELRDESLRVSCPLLRYTNTPSPANPARTSNTTSLKEL